MATAYCRWCTGTCNWELALRRMSGNGFTPRTILDIGACRGDWTNICKLVFPSARVLMIEPLEAKRESLRELARRHKGVAFKPALLGARRRRGVPFYEYDSLSSVFPFHEKPWVPTVRLDAAPLDSIVAGTRFAAPDLVKIHVQGSELEVLRGARKVLAKAEAVFILVSLLELYEGAPLFHDVEALMSARDFRLFDVVHHYHREVDGALAQIDVVFLKNSSALLARRGW